ncbi:MAG: phage major capsid protein [Beijerinckiaceae bacterium]
MKNAKNVNLTLETVAGKRVMMFDEVPVKRCDALLNTETAIT